MKTFKGGCHPLDNKYLSENLKIEEFKIPEKVVIPLSQHIGKPAIPIVKPGDRVFRGERIADADGFISADVHSSVAGEVIAVGNYNHPAAGNGIAVEIKSDDVQKNEFTEKRQWENLSVEEIKNIIKKSGIVGLGGAAFPTFVKLFPPPEKNIDTIVINAVECEPYLTADHRLMLEFPDEIIEGINIILKITGVKKAVIGIESNKMDAVRLLQDKLEIYDDINALPLKLKYPQGAEKQLIDALLGKKIPYGKLPADLGVICVNVGTVFALYEAVAFNKPLIDRIVTVSGRGINNPKNLKIPIGTLFSDIIEFCGGTKNNVKRLIMGGPMMGIAQFTDNVPVIKGASGILLLTEEEAVYAEEEECIRCGKCIRYCPMNLMPCELNKYILLNNNEELHKLNLLDCIECGSCVYVCPVNKKFIQRIRKSKPRVMEWAKRNV